MLKTTPNVVQLVAKGVLYTIIITTITIITTGESLRLLHPLVAGAEAPPKAGFADCSPHVAHLPLAIPAPAVDNVVGPRLCLNVVGCFTLLEGRRQPRIALR